MASKPPHFIISHDSVCWLDNFSAGLVSSYPRFPHSHVWEPGTGCGLSFFLPVVSSLVVSLVLLSRQQKHSKMEKMQWQALLELALEIAGCFCHILSVIAGSRERANPDWWEGKETSPLGGRSGEACCIRAQDARNCGHLPNTVGFHFAFDEM